MLDIKFIRQNPDAVKEGCRKKQVEVDVDKLLEVDKKRREVLQALMKTVKSTKHQNFSHFFLSIFLRPFK